MGQKIGSKILAARAGVPSVPGYLGDDQSDARLIDEAKRIGFPLMVKASAGGGGRGMRRVFSEADLRNALDIARSEAQAAFGDPALLIEKLVMNPRHLEVQVAGDKHGNVVHLFERDCSVQRNNQKLLEEAPAPNLSASIRGKLLERAVALARGIAYDNLGTIEFILEEGQDEPWFLEMNTRLQVEHPVTEAITGLDLVEWQIRIADGEPLPLGQDQIVARGHAIEARVTAERADQDFRPDTGPITGYREPRTIRIDSGIALGSEVTLYYDSMMAKAIAFADTREESCARLRTGLSEFVIAGVSSTIPFLVDAIAHPIFAEGRATTRFIEDAFPGGWTAQRTYARAARAAAAMLFLTQHEAGASMQSAWGRLSGFRILANAGGRATARTIVKDEGIEHGVKLEALPSGACRIIDGEGSFEMNLRRGENSADIETDGRLLHAFFEVDARRVALAIGEERYAFLVTTETGNAASKSASAGSGAIMSPMPGMLAEVKVAVGDEVEADQVVAVLESMKLFLSLATPIAGKVKEIAFSPGQTVSAGAELLVIEPHA